MDSKGRERRGIFVQQQHPKVTSNDCFVSPPISFPGSGKGDLLRTAVTIIKATQRKKRLDGSWVDANTHYWKNTVLVTALTDTNVQI
jgi:hypothetical protein